MWRREQWWFCLNYNSMYRRKSNKIVLDVYFYHFPYHRYHYWYRCPTVALRLPRGFAAMALLPINFGKTMGIVGKDDSFTSGTVPEEASNIEHDFSL